MFGYFYVWILSCLDTFVFECFHVWMLSCLEYFRVWMLSHLDDFMSEKLSYLNTCTVPWFSSNSPIHYFLYSVFRTYMILKNILSL